MFPNFSNAARRSFRCSVLPPLPVLAIQEIHDGFVYLVARPEVSRGAATQWMIQDWGAIGNQDLLLSGDERANPLAVADDSNTNGNGNGNSLNENPASEDIDFWARLLQSKQLLDQPSVRKMLPRRLLLSVSRPTAEFFTLDRVDAIESDITESVHNQLAISEKIDDSLYAIDYITCQSDRSDEMSSDEIQQPPTFAAAIAHEHISRWQTLAKDRKLNLEHIHLRGLALAAWSGNLPLASLEGTCLLIAVYGKQADLILLHQRVVYFARNLHLHSPDAEAIAKQIIGEVRLSIGTVDAAELDESLQHAIVVGESKVTDCLLQHLQDDLEIEGQSVLPLSHPAIIWDGQNIERHSDESEPAALAPLIGLLLSHVQVPGKHVLNLVNPKRIATPSSPLGRYAIWAAALLSIAAVFGFSWYQDYAANNQAMLKIVKAAKQDKALLERVTPKARVVRYLEQWQQGEVNWLEALNSLTQTLPSGDLAVIRQFAGNKTAQGASITMQIHVKNLETIQEIDRSIRESGLTLQFRRVVETQSADFPYRLETSLLAPVPLSDSLPIGEKK